MGYMNKRPTRTQGQFYFSKSDRTGNNCRSESENIRNFLWGLPEVTDGGPQSLSIPPEP